MNDKTFPGLNGRPIEIDAGIIISEVAKKHRLTLQEIKAISKKANIVQARQIAMYLLRRHQYLTLEKIGDIFGGKDHGTVIHAIKTVENLSETDKDYRKILDELTLFVLQKKLPSSGVDIKEFVRMPNWEKKRVLQ